MPMMRCPINSALLVVALFVIVAAPAHAGWLSSAQASPSHPSAKSEEAKEEQLAPEEKMRRRFPHPVRVRDLIGRPVLDYFDNTLGYVQRVVRTRDGKIQLIVRYGGWFGWIGWWQRPVAVPIELVAMLGQYVSADDMEPAQFRASPTWHPSAESSEIGPDETIRIALTKR